MAEKEVVLMKGNEAIAHAAIRCGCDGYFGYPITPQSEVLETLALEKPWETTGMVVLQAESEVASINMVYGAGAAGKRSMTSSSSPGVALMQEGIAYMAGAEIPGLIVNVQRGGPGLGTIQPSQSDYFQATRGGGNGDYNVIVLAPASVQEMADFVDLAFELSFKYRNPAMILSDGVIGQMMEKLCSLHSSHAVRRKKYAGNALGLPWDEAKEDAPTYLRRSTSTAQAWNKRTCICKPNTKKSRKKKSVSNPSCATTRSI